MVMVMVMMSSQKQERLLDQSHYSINVRHTQIYLTGDTTPLYKFPIVQFCSKQRYAVNLRLVDKQESKQDKLTTLQIGSLASSPDCSFRQ